MATLDLLGSLSRVETPYIKVQIGAYTFGVYTKEVSSLYEDNTSVLFNEHRVQYPNFIKDLRIQKINGQVNMYTLQITYPVVAGADPNFFEKVFGSVVKTRKIVFSYGDLSVPSFIYKNEEAIIISVKSNVTAATAVINYTVTAVSSVRLTSAAKKDFQAKFCQPSSRILWLLENNEEFGLQDVFYGMRDIEKIKTDGLIRTDDAPVQLEYKANMSALDYLLYCVESMVYSGDNVNSTQLSTFYSLVIHDDTTGLYDGPYFEIVKVDKNLEHPEAYSIDIGYPSQNIVTKFEINTDEGYSLLYDYTEQLDPEHYTYRVNSKGEMETVYSPIISSANNHFETKSDDKIWWSKVTQFPITVTLTLKGLLRPAILMTYVRLNVYFYGAKHISSGLYIITQQVDQVGLGGFTTTLTMLKISGDS